MVVTNIGKTAPTRKSRKPKRIKAMVCVIKPPARMFRSVAIATFGVSYLATGFQGISGTVGIVSLIRKSLCYNIINQQSPVIIAGNRPSGGAETPCVINCMPVIKLTVGYHHFFR